jgi:hypothetical protein
MTRQFTARILIAAFCGSTLALVKSMGRCLRAVAANSRHPAATIIELEGAVETARARTTHQ